jgi:hypothetical protein
MKKLFLIPLALGLTFCHCQKATVATAQTKTTIESPCPENGVCTIQIQKGKSMVVKTDAFGSIYYTLEEDATKSVIVYEYKRNVEKGLQDGQHREEIVFEINNSDTKLSLNDGFLQSTKMLFGRHCFCKGQAGYYKVTEGNLNLENNKGTITVDLDFKVTKVPQLYTTVKATIQ